METINFSFKIATLIFLLIFIFISQGKLYIDTLQNKMYRNMVWTFLLINFFDILANTLHLYHTGSPIAIMHLINVAYFMLYLLAPEVFVLFALSIANKPKVYYDKRLVLLKSTALIYMALLITNPITGWIYRIGPNNQYEKGPYNFVIYLIVAYHMLLAFIVIFRKKNDIKSRDRITCEAVLIMFFVAVFVQNLMPVEFIIIPMAEIIAIILLQFLVQAPEYYIDKDTGLFNSVGFTQIISEYQMHHKAGIVLALCFEELSKSDKAQILKSIKKELGKYIIELSKQTCYLYGQEMYILCENEHIADHLCAVIIDRMKEAFVIHNEEYIIGIKILNISDIKCMDSAENIYSITAFFNKHKEEFGDVSYYEIDFMNKYKRREEIKKILTEAIRTDGIKIFYQPIYSVERKCLDTAECLVRLKDDRTIGFISPEEFIPIAEEENMILPLEDLIFEHICRFIQTEQLFNKKIKYIDINLSGKQCKERSLSDKLISVIKKCNIPLDFINVEITETSAVTTNQRLIYNMEKLGDVGITFSLDDFGSGYSNFKNLSKLPFNVVKLDKSLVWAYFEDEKGRIILENIINMLQQLGTYVLAEGVETEEQKDILIQMGVKYLQGFYFSKPLPEDEYLKIIDN